MIKQFFLFTFFTIIFSTIIFFGNVLFLSKKESIEEIYILENKNSLKEEKILEYKKKSKKNIDNIFFRFFPKDFEKKTLKEKQILKEILISKIFKNKASNLKIEFHKEKPNVRGNMKNATLKLFGVLEMGREELISVTIHELSHYIDLYFLKNNKINDDSYKFYNISREETKIIKKGQSINDFVSGYSMSNKYEDFAESFTYYILHNSDFQEKGKKSNILKRKYIFFKEYIFKEKTFINSDFKTINSKKYYWDITKINFSLQKFLQYLKKRI